MLTAYVDALKKYFTLKGVATRKQYWYFVFANLIISILFGFVVVAQVMPEIVYWIYAALIFIPTLTLTVRRLHDSGHSGWWIGIIFVWLFLGLLLALTGSFSAYYGRMDIQAIVSPVMVIYG